MAENPDFYHLRNEQLVLLLFRGFYFQKQNSEINFYLLNLSGNKNNLVI